MVSGRGGGGGGSKTKPPHAGVEGGGGGKCWRCTHAMQESTVRVQDNAPPSPSPFPPCLPPRCLSSTRHHAITPHNLLHLCLQVTHRPSSSSSPKMDGTRELHLNSEGSEVTEEYEEDVDVKDYDDKHEGAAEDSLEGSDGPAASIVDCPDDWVNPTGKNVVLGRHSQKYSHTAHLGFYALGLRAYIMFPYCMAHYGGGAFLAVFALLLAVVGVTASLTEMSWGQALNQGMPRVFDEIHPRWTGATASASAAVLMLLCSNTLLVGYCGVYFFNCFRAGDVPWQGEAAGAFWVDSMHGTLTLPLILSLAGACGVQACCQLSTSFMRYATLLIPFPAVVLAVALIRAVSLGGAQDGLNWMFAFDLNDLVSGSTWSAAVGQV